MQPEPAMPGFNRSASGHLRVEAMVNVNIWAVNKIQRLVVMQLLRTWNGTLLDFRRCDAHDSRSLYLPTSGVVKRLPCCGGILFQINPKSFQALAESWSLRCLSREKVDSNSKSAIPWVLGSMLRCFAWQVTWIFASCSFNDPFWEIGWIYLCRWNEVVRVVVGMSSSIDVFYWRILRCTWTCEEWLLTWEHVPYMKELFKHDFHWFSIFQGREFLGPVSWRVVMSWVSWQPGKSSPFGIGDIYVLDMGPATMAQHPAADLTI